MTLDWKSTGYLLARTCRLLRVRAHAFMDEMGLHRGQHFALRVLWAEDGITHSDLAQRMDVSPATVSNMLKRMARGGLIERRPDDDDQRVSRVYLTEKGRAIRERVENTWCELEGRALAGFTSHEQELLEQFLTRIRENLSHEIGHQAIEKGCCE